VFSINIRRDGSSKKKRGNASAQKQKERAHKFRTKKNQNFQELRSLQVNFLIIPSIFQDSLSYVF